METDRLGEQEVYPVDRSGVGNKYSCMEDLLEGWYPFSVFYSLSLG